MSFVLGMSGHVDHGKSTLLAKLTGKTSDRLPEEKRRGMTIDLNFASLETSFGTVGIVDVPGHQRFVKNMITGVASVDGFIFVVAADDGWMPQSEEHLLVLSSLGVKAGIAVITKTDLVSASRVKEVREDVEIRCELGFGKPIPCVEIGRDDSSDRLRGEIEKLLPQLKRDGAGGSARLWIDRVFSPQGLGVVVTGTLREGALTVGDQVRIWPGNLGAEVRGLESYHKVAKTVLPGTRVAVQLTKVALPDLKRGMLLSTNENEHLATTCDARVQWFKKPPRKPVHLSLHLGTDAYQVLSIPLGDRFIRIRSRRMLPVRVGDRAILRTSGEERTVGVACLLDVETLTRQHKRAKDCLERALEPGGGIELHYRKRGYLDKKVYDATHADRLIVGQLAGKYLEIGRGLWVLADDWKAISTRACEFIREANEKTGNALAEGELRARLAKEFIALENSALYEVLAKELLANGIARERAGWILVKSKKSVDPAAERLARATLELLDSGVPQTRNDLSSKIPGSERIVYELVKEGLVVRLGEDAFVAKSAYLAMCSRVRDFLRARSQATTSELRLHLQISRKPVIFILEQMDRDRITYLKDGVRRLLKEV